MLFRKTETTRRENYQYHFATGETVVLTPEECGEEMIHLLHREDDRLVYNNIKNGKPKLQEWQKEGIARWKAQHPGEEPPKNWNISLDGLEQTDEADCSSYMKTAADCLAAETEEPQRALLRAVAETLPEDEAELYRLHFIYGLPQQEIAGILGVSQMTVSKRIRKLTEKLIRICPREV